VPDQASGVRTRDNTFFQYSSRWLTTEPNRSRPSSGTT
jgi:hypothetical protein